MDIGRTSSLTCCKLLFMFLTISACCVRLTVGQNRQNNRSEVSRLIHEKLRVYDKKVRPLQNLSKPVDIKVGLDLLSIKEFNEVLETITIVGFLRLHWTDELMAWDPNEFAATKDILVDVGDIWTPDLVLLNPVDEFKKVENKWGKIYINSDGGVQHMPGAVFNAICKMDTSFYPWDIQTCLFPFYMWGYSSLEIQLHLFQTEVMQSFYNENGEWEIIGSSSKYRFQKTLVEFKIHLKRRSQFVLVNMILPIIFMSFLNVLAFLIPTASGERLSYCITVLLAQAVFLTIVGDSLPKTSDPMSVLSYYLLAVLTISVSITVSVILSIAVYFREETLPVPKYLSKLTRVLSTEKRDTIHEQVEAFEEVDITTVCMQEKHRQGRIAGHSDQNNMESPDANRSNVPDTLDFKMATFKKNERNAPMKCTNEEYYSKRVRARGYLVSWKDVSVAMDRIMFVVFLLSNVGCMTWAMVRIVRNK